VTQCGHDGQLRRHDSSQVRATKSEVNSGRLPNRESKADEKNLPHVGAYLKYKAGWAQSLTKITSGLAATAVAGSNRFFIHRKGMTEYFILENRFQQGRDLALPGSGLAIWRIDEEGDNQFEHMTPTHHYECSLVQADGRNDLENDPYNQGNATDLFAHGGNAHFGGATNPKSSWWDGTASNLDVSAISASGAEMTFTGNV
jgi:hypothetical protein